MSAVAVHCVGLIDALLFVRFLSRASFMHSFYAVFLSRWVPCSLWVVRRGETRAKTAHPQSYHLCIFTNFPSCRGCRCCPQSPWCTAHYYYDVSSARPSPPQTLQTTTVRPFLWCLSLFLFLFNNTKRHCYFVCFVCIAFVHSFTRSLFPFCCRRRCCCCLLSLGVCNVPVSCLLPLLLLFLLAAFPATSSSTSVSPILVVCMRQCVVTREGSLVDAKLPNDACSPVG